MKPAKIEQLEAVGPEWLRYQREWSTIEDLRAGYETIKDKVTQYITRRPAEDDETYLLRTRNLSYTPVLSQTIREFAAKLSSAPVSVSGINLESDDFWARWFEQIDGKNQDEPELLNELFSDLLWYGSVFVAVDLPNLYNFPRSRAEDPSDRLPFVRVFKPMMVRQRGDDWYQTRQTITRHEPLDVARHFIQWTYWTPTETTLYELEVSIDSFGACVQCKLPQSNKWEPYKGSLEIPPKKTLVNPLGVPLMTHLELPLEMWVGYQTYPKQIEHLIIENSWLDAGSVAGTIQRVFKPTPPKPMDDVRVAYQEPDLSGLKSDNAHILIGDGFQFNESTGAAIAALTSQLETVERQIRALASMGYASVQKSAMEQSGASKQVDMDMLVTSMQAYGKKLVQLYQDILTLTSGLAGRGEEPVVTGLDAYGTNNLTEMIDQTIKIMGLIDIMPSTALKLWLAKLVEALLGNLAIDSQAAVYQELEGIDIDGIRAQLAAEKQAEVSAKKAPGGKPRANK
jgi:hypothetical protein